MVALWNRADHYIFILWFLLLLLFFPRLILAIAEWMSAILAYTHGVHAACWKYRTQKSCQKSPSGHHRTTLSGYIFVIKARINNRKKLVKQQYLFHISPNMVNFGPLTAEIDPVVCDTPENFNGFRVLAVTAAMSLNGRQPNFARWLAVFWAGTQHIHFWGFLPRYGFSLCVQVLRSRILAALLHGGWLVGV